MYDFTVEKSIGLSHDEDSINQSINQSIMQINQLLYPSSDKVGAFIKPFSVPRFLLL